MSHPDENSSSKTGTAIVLHPVLPDSVSTVTGHRAVEDVLEEAAGLARAIWLDIIECRAVKVARPSPATLFGKGAVETIAELVRQMEPTIVIVDHALTPIQQRNLEKEWDIKVLDRTGLILEIFGARAKTKEGQIQIDLAALEYQQSRLVRSWTHLERQRGGTGTTGGPGETQLEIDRRLIRDKIARLKKDLEQVRRTRELQRKGREKVPFPIVALVGYTNAGKSTLFNRLTRSDVFAKDLLFATLDPTMRQLKLPNGQEVILSDTVGFISNLPTNLIAAFRATLEQVQHADVILHVRDIARHDTDAQRGDVVDVLQSLGIDYEADDRIIEALNKTDALPQDVQDDIRRRAAFDDRSAAISALSGEGLDRLLEMIMRIVSKSRKTLSYAIRTDDGEALAWLYSRAQILERKDGEAFITLTAAIDPADEGRFQDRFGYKAKKGRKTA
ncbi:MAG: GTPase HflX [Micavibrio aeruginosavorus]|nr:GTPase HflX [Micavibrio aeruginosavorus]